MATIIIIVVDVTEVAITMEEDSTIEEVVEKILLLKDSNHMHHTYGVLGGILYRRCLHSNNDQ